MLIYIDKFTFLFIFIIMIKSLIKFYTSHRYAVIWTACYVTIMWVILRVLFEFNMFSWTHWHILMHAHLRGFPGFVFGILMLAALPMYVATTMLIVRTGKPLIQIPKPKIPALIKKLIPAQQKSAPTETDTPAAPTDQSPQPEPSPELPVGLPNELHAAFIRARNNPPFEFQRPDAAHTPSDTNVTAPTDNQMDPDGLPLPMDFGFEDSTPTPSDSFVPAALPTFTSIDFDSPAPASSAPIVVDTPAPDSELTDVINHIRSSNRDFTLENNVILCADMAIGAHTNPEFWIADDDDWFATGLQKPSPVAAAIRAATAHGVTPVIYLGAKNIMDIDGRIAAWTANGVRVITDLDQI